MSSAASDSTTPSGVPAVPGFPAISTAPKVAAATPAQDAGLTRSPRNLALSAIRAGITPTSSAASVTLTRANPSNCTRKATP